MSGRRRHAGGSPHDFPAAAREALADEQLRANMGRATQTIRARRAAAVAELADFEELREQARRIKDDALGRLDELLARFEAAATAAGAQVHHAPDAAAACAVVADIARRNGVTELVKMKSLATDEIRLDAALAEAGVEAVETDLAELIVQLAGDTASHILVPAVHYSRGQIRDIFRRTIAAERELSDDPSELAEVSRLYLRERFLRAGMGVTGCNIAVAETGTVCVVENEGNGRMVTTLPPVLVSVVGIEKVVPSPADLGLLLRLLPRSATGERMSSYVSLLTGVTSGDGPLPADGPREYHIVLLDNGRRNALADPVGRQALRCIRCSACLNVCPVYTRVGGHAYGSIYPGPIGAVLTPQLWGMEEHAKLPFASTLCGACAEVCPVGIDIPGVLLYLRARAVREQAPAPEKALFGAAAWTFGSPRRFAAAQRAGRAAELPLVRGGLVRTLPPPLAGWSEGRDLRPVARETFREWWARERGTASGAAAAPPDAGEVPWGGGAVTPGVPESRAADPAVPESRAGADLLRLLVERLEGAHVEVRRVAAGDVAAEVARVCVAHGVRRLGVPPGLPADWRPAGAGLEGGLDTQAGTDSWAGVDVVEDHGLSPAELDALDGALTGCTLAVAETGSLVLAAGSADGRRALSLVPDVYLCVVREDQVVPDLAAAMVPIAALVKETGRPVVFVSGPSATSDIELHRVEGVHGPRRLVVLLVSA